jgi:hypothetical protein
VKDKLAWIWKEGFVMYPKILSQYYIEELGKATNVLA